MNIIKFISIVFLILSLILFLIPYISILQIIPAPIFSLRFLFLAASITAYGLSIYKVEKKFISNLESQIKKTSKPQHPIIKKRINKKNFIILKRALSLLSLLILLPIGIFVFNQETIMLSGILSIEEISDPLKVQYMANGKRSILDSRSVLETKAALDRNSKIKITLVKPISRNYVFGKEDFMSWEIDHWEVLLNQPLQNEASYEMLEGPLRIINKTEIPLLSYFRKKNGEKVEISGEFSVKTPAQQELALGPQFNNKNEIVGYEPYTLISGDIVFIKLARLSLPLRGFIVGFDEAFHYKDSTWQLEITESDLTEHKAPVYLRNYSGNIINAQILSYSDIPMYQKWAIPPSAINNQEYITLVDKNSEKVTVLEGYKLHVSQNESVLYEGNLKTCPFVNYQVFIQKWLLKFNDD